MNTVPASDKEEIQGEVNALHFKIIALKRMFRQAKECGMINRQQEELAAANLGLMLDLHAKIEVLVGLS